MKEGNPNAPHYNSSFMRSLTKSPWRRRPSQPGPPTRTNGSLPPSASPRWAYSSPRTPSWSLASSYPPYRRCRSPDVAGSSGWPSGKICSGPGWSLPIRRPRRRWPCEALRSILGYWSRWRWTSPVWLPEPGRACRTSLRMLRGRPPRWNWPVTRWWIYRMRRNPSIGDLDIGSRRWWQSYRRGWRRGPHGLLRCWERLEEQRCHA